MFKDFKSGGYNLESTQVQGERFDALLVLISLAYLCATFHGQLIKHQGLQPYLGRVNEPHRYIRRHSSFYLGSNANLWVGLPHHCSALITELLILTPNKRLRYLRGERAKTLILARL